MSNRVPRMAQKLAEAGFTHALIHKRQNMFYLTGYTGEGCLFVGPEGAVILTDFRYTEQAERQAPGCRIIRTGAGVLLVIAAITFGSMWAISVESTTLAPPAETPACSASITAAVLPDKRK